MSNPPQVPFNSMLTEWLLRGVFCLTELGLNLSQGVLAATISIMFYGTWNVLGIDVSAFDMA